MALTGICLGLLAAVLIHLRFGKIRGRWPKLLAVVGWVVAVIVLFYVIMLTLAFLSMRNDPGADLGPVWGMFAMILGTLLLVCGGFGFLHRRRFGISWAQAFGIVMSEAAVAILVGFLFQENLYNIADIVRGGNEEVGSILASYERVRVMLGNLDLTLLAALLVLIPFTGFKTGVRGRRAAPAPFPDSTPNSP